MGEEDETAGRVGGGVGTRSIQGVSPSLTYFYLYQFNICELSSSTFMLFLMVENITRVVRVYQLHSFIVKNILDLNELTKTFSSFGYSKRTVL